MQMCEPELRDTSWASNLPSARAIDTRARGRSREALAASSGNLCQKV